MLDKEKYIMIFLLIIALCIASTASTHTAAQTISNTAYGPSQYDGCLTYPTFFAFPVSYQAPPSGSSAQFPTAAPTITPTPIATPTQGPATIYGTVTDSNGTAVAGVIVRLQGPSGSQYSTTSSKDGYFEISNVPYDSYTFSYTHGSYSSPMTTLAVNTNSVKRDISLPAQAEGTAAIRQAPAAIDHSAIKNWYATYYTPPTLSNQSVIYGQSGRIVKVVTGNPCNIVEVPISGH